jgi:hypothetical protein
MRIPSGTVDQYIYFVAVDATDLKTRETGLSSFTVRRSRNGAASAAFTTPTVNETDVTNMPGVYELLLDEDTTIAAGNTSEELALHITHAGMAPVTRTIELYRPSVTEGGILAAPNSTVDFGFNKDATSQTVYITIRDVWGNPLTGLAFNTASLTAYYVRPLGSATAITLATQTVGGAFSSGGFVEVSAANMPGVYRFDLVNAILATGVDNAKVVLKGAANMQQFVMNIALFDPINAVAGRVPIIWAEAFTFNSGETAASAVAGAAVYEIINNVDLAALQTVVDDIQSKAEDLQARTPAALTAAGNMKADSLAWNGLTTVALPLVPTVAGRTLDVSAGGEAGVDWANVGTPGSTVSLSATTVSLVTTTTTATNLTNAPTNGDLTATMKTSVTTAATAATPTAAAVTGAVGSVTGNVGGNVVGSVASVVGAVGSVTGLTASNLDATISSRATPAQVNSEVVDALATDTYAEPGQGAPSATASIATKINYLYKAFRNKFTQTGSEFKLFNDDAATVDQKATVSDDGTTFTRNEIGTGP